jgi:hypothetical protein
MYCILISLPWLPLQITNKALLTLPNYISLFAAGVRWELEGWGHIGFANKKVEYPFNDESFQDSFSFRKLKNLILH